jgi:glycine/sarcosine N-methyltransferase
VTGEFGGAICLGNTLPHLTASEDLAGFLGGAREHLLAGAPLLIQILNYDRIFERGERSLPINFRHGDEGETVFLRLMDLRDDGTVGFFPTALLFQPDADPPLTIKATKRVELRGWRSTQLESQLRAAGFETVETYGAYDGAAFVSDTSRDLIVVAR